MNFSSQKIALKLARSDFHFPQSQSHFLFNFIPPLIYYFSAEYRSMRPRVVLIVVEINMDYIVTFSAH